MCFVFVFNFQRKKNEKFVKFPRTLIFGGIIRFKSGMIKHIFKNFIYALLTMLGLYCSQAFL